MAPIQVDLLQASGQLAVEIHLLAPCRDLWQRRGQGVGERARATGFWAVWIREVGILEMGILEMGIRAPGIPMQSEFLKLDPTGFQPSGFDPLGDEWRLSVPSLEARFGRLGAEFQQLLEGSGDTQLGESQQRGSVCRGRHDGGNGQERPRSAARKPAGATPTGPGGAGPGPAPGAAPGDDSLEFHACPGQLRQVQILRDRLLQLLAADASLTPRDILVMTPQVEAFALVAAVFGDTAATGIALPWRLTDRSQQDQGGLATSLLALLRLGGERLTASGLEALLSHRPLLETLGLGESELSGLGELLQRAGFRWGLDANDRGGEPCHSLAWAIDRLVLGLVLPEQPGLAPGDCAPLAMAGSLERQARWLQLLNRLRHSLKTLAIARTPADWAPVLDQLLLSWFGDGGERAWALQLLRTAIADWQEWASASPLRLGAPVLAEVLAERLECRQRPLRPPQWLPDDQRPGADAGHSPPGDRADGPRWRQLPAPGGAPRLPPDGATAPAGRSQPRRSGPLRAAGKPALGPEHLLVSWCSRDERNGDARQPATPVRQWLALLEQQLGREQAERAAGGAQPQPPGAGELPAARLPSGPSCDLAPVGRPPVAGCRNAWKRPWPWPRGGGCGLGPAPRWPGPWGSEWRQAEGQRCKWRRRHLG
jgi:exodeoxyribonuclease V gamma subunit